MSELQNNIEVDSMLPVGTLLQGGKYRIERYLSSGGFGNTYVATNIEFDEQVAIKEFFMRGVSQRDDDSVSVSVSNQTNLSQFVSQKEKFRKEARRLRKLRNNHIVAVHDLFEENGTVYYEMDLIKGESLSERLKRTGQPLSETEVVKILHQVLDALAIVHAQGLYHLDLKPANIMIDQAGCALLIDFGASKQMSVGDGESVSTSSALAFTPGYAPLEQTEQYMKNFGPWTDLYALGATLYKLLTNQTPPSASEILMSRDPLVFPADVSQRLRDLIAWMMRPRIDERPQSVAEVLKSLNASNTPPIPTPKEKQKPTAHVDEETEIIVKQPKPKVEKANISQTPPPVSPPTPTRGTPLKEEKKKTTALYAGIGVAAVVIIVLAVILMHQSKNTDVVEQVESMPESSRNAILSDLEANMVYVDGGTFTMGATREQGSDARSNEKPAHQVTVSSFSICKYEVTQELWEAVMGSNPSRFKGAKLPVEQVSWNDCQEFISQLNQLTGKNYRLPTEAEWEYAARGGNQSNGYKYAGGNNIDDVAWYDGNSEKRTHDVGTKRANELGLYDMSGNVWEFCSDIWHDDLSYISSREIPAPETAEDDLRPHRGGCWPMGADGCRVSIRYKCTRTFYSDFIGLRLAL